MQKPFVTICSFVLGLAKTHLGQPLPAIFWDRPNVSSYDPIGTTGSWHSTIGPNDMPALFVVMLAVMISTTIGGVLVSCLVHQLAEDGGTGVNRAPFCAQPSAGAYGELAPLARADATKAPNVIQNDNGRRTATAISPVFEAGPINAVVYGVKCDSSSDDSAAFVVAQAASVASGRPLQWPPGVCILDNVTLESNATHVGAKSGTTWLRKPNSTARAFLYGNGIHSLTLQSLKVDGNQVHETQGANNIQCARSCYNLTLDGVTSTNGKYAAGYGDGFFASASADILNGTKTRILNSNLSGNGGNGIEVQGGGGYVVDKFSASNNARTGITFSTNAFPPILGISDYLTITNGDASQNGVDGISVGGFYTGGTPARPIWGPGTPQSRNGVVSGNRAVANGRYGVVWQGESGSITRNTVRRNGSPGGSGGGILFNASNSTLSDNIVDDNDNYNVDAGGATYSTISGNTLKNVDVTARGWGVSLNVGGGLNINVDHNDLYNNRGIAIYAIGVEGAGQNSIFEHSSRGLNISNNIIMVPGGTSSGITVSQGADYVTVRDNSVYGAAAGYAFNLQGGSGAHSLFSLQESGNVDWSNGGVRPTVVSAANLVIPDIGADEYVSGTSPVSRIDTQSSNFYAGKVRWVVPRNSVGRAYSADRPPIVTFSGGGCTITPTGTAMISNGGAFVGVHMTNYGAGCTSPPKVSLSSGMSTGTAQIGLNNYRDREITLHFLAAASVVTGGNLDLSSAGAFKAESGCQLKLRGTLKGWYEIGRSC